MVKKRDKYDWVVGEMPPPIDPHSLVKHKIVESYLERYVQVLMANWNIEQLTLSVVDGFAGGGEYSSVSGGDYHDGSPLLALRTLGETEVWLNFGREKRRRINGNYYFVEKKKSNFEYLQSLLGDRGYESRIGKDVFLFKDQFHRILPKILPHIKKRKGGERAFFLLDQYAYDDVPMGLLKLIFGALRGAEVLLTFNVDSLVSFLSDNQQNRNKLEEIGLAKHIDWQFFTALKDASNPNWKGIIQRMLAHGIIKESGAKYSTIFYITPMGYSPWTYWLIHLSNVYRARDVMMELHWGHANHFSHYLDPDIFTLGCDANRDELISGQTTLDSEGFNFDAMAEERCRAGLSEKLTRKLHDHREPITFAELVTGIGNSTPATAKLIRQSLSIPIQVGDLVAKSAKGVKREKGASLKETDILIPSRQTSIFLMSQPDLVRQ
jgi:three-Cys-motif partner protein